MIEEVATVRTQLWDGGFRPVPVFSFDHGEPHERGKRPLSRDWPELARQDPPSCLAFPVVPWAANSGILADGLRLFDFDIDDADLAARCIDLVRARLGDTSRRCRQNSGRSLLLYRAAEGEPKKLTLAGVRGKIEVLGYGQQAVVHGVHASGVPLVWTPFAPWELRRESLPAVTEAEVIAVLNDLAPLIGAERITGRRERGNGHDKPEADEPQADALQIAVALAAIPNEGPADWEWWNRVGMAVWRAAGGAPSGFDAFDAWSRRSPCYSAEETRRRWAHYPTSPPTEIGFATLVYMAAVAEAQAHAQRAGFGASASRVAEPPPEPEPEPEEDEWPEPMDLAAFHGLFGTAVAEIMPHTEADPHGLLIHLLTFFGNKIGRGPHYLVGAARHATNLYVLLVGATSRARKGTAATEIRRLFAAIPLDLWLDNCVQAGLSSGEGLIHAVRDERRGKNKKGEDEVLDEGVTEKRLLVVESEFASVLAVMKREGNTLSPVLRTAWDHDRLQTMTKNTPEKATGTLVSVIAHITADELRSAVDRIALTNGLLNRVLFALVKRARLLPHGGWPDPMKLQRIGVELDEAVKAAQAIGAMSMTGDAADLWASIYPALTTDHPGLFGSLVARAEAHVVRLALLYALADCRRAIEPVHLEAALAVWRYSEASARILFGDLTGEPVSDDMLALLRMAGAVGMTRTELLNDVGRHVTRRRIQAGLDLLRRIGCARRSVRIDPHVPGPAAEVWTYVPPGRR